MVGKQGHGSGMLNPDSRVAEVRMMISWILSGRMSFGRKGTLQVERIFLSFLMQISYELSLELWLLEKT